MKCGVYDLKGIWKQKEYLKPIQRKKMYVERMVTLSFQVCFCHVYMQWWYILSDSLISLFKKEDKYIVFVFEITVYFYIL